MQLCVDLRGSSQAMRFAGLELLPRVACLSLGPVGEYSFSVLSLYGKDVNCAFWAALGAFEAMLMYNVKKREAVLRKYPSSHSSALTRLLCLWNSTVCKVNLVTGFFFFSFLKLQEVRLSERKLWDKANIIFSLLCMIQNTNRFFAVFLLGQNKVRGTPYSWTN